MTSTPIVGISPVSIPGFEKSSTPSPAGTSFGDLLKEAVSRVDGYQKGADVAVEKFLKGEDEDLHRVAMTTQQAEVSFELFLQMKNKVMQAYQEVMRMQV